MNQDSITMSVAGAVVTLPAATLTKLWLEHVQRLAIATPAREPAVAHPKIGETWPGQGGIYAGISRGQNGAPDYHVILHDADKAEIKWKDASAWASGLEADGHRDFALPTRNEQALLFANLKDRFEAAWYWSGETYASASESAWYQYFDTGYQDYDPKTNTLRARAVRRAPIQ